MNPGKSFFLPLLLLFLPVTIWAQTSWKGTVSTAWNTAANWTNGVPTASVDAVIGDGNFTGSFQPAVTTSAACRALTLTTGGKAPLLTIGKALTVSGDLTLNSGCTISQKGVTLTVKGNWINNGSYTGTSTSSRVTMGGTTQNISGSVATPFRRLTVAAGSTTTLNQNCSITTALSVSGILTAAETATPFAITGLGTTSVTATGTLQVTAPTFAANYGLTGTTTLSAGSTVEYSATTANQTILQTLTYSTLKISGALVKTAGGNLNTLNSSSATAGRIDVTAGTLDLSTFTANRGTTVAGGAITVANGAFLRIGGTNTFPANFATHSLSLTSTVEYYGAAQTVFAETYGNLTLSGSGTKTLPATAFTVSGNLTSAGSVSYTAAANITISGNLNVGASTTFNGGSFTHTITGNWINNGTFTGNTSTINMNGPGTSISGTGTQNFNNLTFFATNITGAATTSINVAGNLMTAGAGKFTHATGGTFTMSGAAKTISGTDLHFDNLTISGTITTTSSITLTGNLLVSGTFNDIGTITMSGAAKTISGAGTIGFGSLLIPGSVTTAVSFSIGTTLDVSGSFSASAGTATFTGNSTLNGTANLFNATINGTSLQLSANAVLGIAAALTVTAGTLNTTSTIPNTVNFNGSTAQSVDALTYEHLLLSNAGTKTAAGNITTNYLSIAAGTTFSAGSFTHTVQNNWANAGTFTAGSSTVVLSGASAATISGNNTFSTLTLNKTANNTVTTLASNTSAGTLNMTSGMMNTGSNSMTITVNRFGNGIILGTIIHNHPFTAFTAYAFEGPNTTIEVPLPLSGTITMTVTTGPVTDFPQGAAVNRVYTISTGLSLGLSTLRLHYEDAELNGNNEATMTMWRNQGGGWNNMNKSGNNIPNNYVELTVGLLDNLSGRWTLSNANSVVRWNGSVSSDWFTPANWTPVTGTSRVPGITDIAEIGTAAFNNQPGINNAASIKSLYFGSTEAATLTLTSGGSLTTQGNINGTWSAGAIHNINAGAQTITVGGDLTLSDGTAGHAINVSASNGTIDVAGSIVQSGGANISFTGAELLSIGSDFNHISGTFTPGTSTVTYDGTMAQNIAGVAYDNIVVNKTSGLAILNSAATAAGTLNVNAGTLVTNANVTVNSDVSIAAGATFNNNAATITTGGNWDNNGAFNSSGGTVILNGSGTQTVTATTFNNLTIDKTGGTATLSGNAGINGNLSVNAGTLDLSAFTANRSVSGGTFTLANGTMLLAGGANNFPAGYSNDALGNTSTVNYDGTVAQSVAGVSYGNLVFTNAGVKTLAATCTVNGDITISSGATLNGSSFVINLFGNWVNSGTFAGATGTVTLNGATKTITGTTTFNRLTVYGSYTVSGSNITYNGLLTVTGSGAYNAGSGTATVSGDLTNNGSLVSNGTTTFTGTAVQTIRLINAITSNSSGIINFNGTVPPVLNSTSTPTFATLNINNTGGINPSVGWQVLVAFNISSGAIFNGGISTHNIFGSFTNNGIVTSSGGMNFTPSTAQTIQLAGTTFSSTGNVLFGGTAAMTVTGTPTALNNVIIDNTSGVTPSAGWTMSGNFSIHNNAIFNAGANSYTVAGSIESSGTLNGGTSTFTMTSATGELTGSIGTTFYDFVISSTGDIEILSDFNIAHNFTNNGLIDATVGAPAMTGSLPATITGAAASFDLAQLTVQKTAGTVVTLSKGLTSMDDLSVLSGTLDETTAAITSNTGSILDIENNARLIIRGTLTLPAFSTYQLDTLSFVEYGGANTAQAISSATPYGNLVISGAGTKTASAALKINNNFSLSNGNFVPGSFTDTLNGNWSMTSGTYTNTSSTLYLNGAGAQDIFSTGAFNNLTVKKPTGNTTISSNITVNSILNFITGKIRTGTFTLIQPATGTVTGASQSTGWVIGNLQKTITTGATSRSFELGDINFYSPATVTLANVTASGNLLATVTATDHPAIASSAINAGRSVNRYWSFTNTGTVFTTATLSLNWNSADVDAGSTTANFKVSTYNGSTWSYPASALPLATSIQATGLTVLTSDFAVGELVTANTWTGNVNTNWFLAGNWSAGIIPISITNALIPTGRPNYPIVTGGIATTNNITIQTAAAVTVNTTLQIGGVISNSGAFNATAGTIEFNGSNMQTIPANTFTTNTVGNLTVKNIVGVTIAGTLNVSGVVKATTGNLQTGGFLTLLSTAAQTALIDGSGNGSVTGNVTVQRYLPSRFGYHYLSSPFTAVTVLQFSNEVDLLASFPALYRYVENRASSGWVAYTTATNLLIPMVGYAANLGDATTPVTVDAKGIVNNGTITAPTPTNSGEPYTQGFNLVGNPYPSPVDWDAGAGWIRTNIDNAIYYFNNGTTDQYEGTYSSYINGVSSDGVANNIVPAMQGFFIHVSNGTFPVTGELTVSNQARVNNLTPNFHRDRPSNLPLLRVAAAFDEFQPDPAVAYFEDGATVHFEQEMDALKLMNTDANVPSLYIMADTERLSISALPAQINTDLHIPLGINTAREGYVTFSQLTAEQFNLQAYLYDAKANTTYDLPYRLLLPKGTIEDRFSIVFKPADTNTTTNGAFFNAYGIGGNLYAQFDKVPGEKCTINVTNLSGQFIFSGNFTGNGRYLLGPPYNTGVYIVTFYTSKEKVSKKVFIGN